MSDRAVQTSEIGVQTDIEPPTLPPRPHSMTYRSSMAGIPEVGSIDAQIKSASAETTPVDPVPTESESMPQPESMPESTPEREQGVQTEAPVTKVESKKSSIMAEDVPLPDETDDADDEESDEEPVIVQATKPQIITARPQVITKARMVNIAKPIPPALPPRNPGRLRGSESRSPTRPAEPELEVQTDVPQADEPPVTASTASSVYSLSIQDEPSSTHTSQSGASVSSVDPEQKHSEHKHEPKSMETLKPQLPPRTETASSVETTMPGSFA